MMAERYREHCNHPVTESYEIKNGQGTITEQNMICGSGYRMEQPRYSIPL